MKLAIIAALVAIFLGGCQDATSSTPQAPAPATPLSRTAQKLADGTCGARLVHDSLVGSYVPYGAYCPVPEDLRTPHKDGSLPNAQHGAGVAYMTWTTDNGDCAPVAEHLGPVTVTAWCPKKPENFRWMYDTAYKMPNEITYGMPMN